MIQKLSRGHYNSCILLICIHYSSAPESNRPNLPDGTMDLPFFFRYKHITSLRSLPSPAPSESLPYWFQGNFAATFVLNFWLRDLLLSAFANRFELRCEPKQLMLLYYKICPCCAVVVATTGGMTVGGLTNCHFQSIPFLQQEIRRSVGV